jgi:hypothetical protein
MPKSIDDNMKEFLQTPEMVELAEKAGVIDAEQLIRFMSIEQRIAEGSVVDVTDMSPDEWLSFLTGDS